MAVKKWAIHECINCFQKFALENDTDYEVEEPACPVCSVTDTTFHGYAVLRESEVIA